MSGKFLIGADRYRKAPEARQTEAGDLIARANTVSIFDILQDYFGLDLPREGNSYKSRCPFYFEHADGGLDKGFRTYPATNSAYCFVQHGVMGPVRLLQIRNEVRQIVAAKDIVERYGLIRPRGYAARYRELLVASERGDDLGSAAYAVEALHLALNQVPGYGARQFDEDVTDLLEVHLEALDEVMSDPSATADAVRGWYRSAKSALTALVALH